MTSLRTIANRYLKRWAGLYSRAVVSILYRQRKKYGLQLTCLVSFYKRLQVGQTFLLKHSDDNNLKIIYDMLLTRQRALSRVWRPAPCLDDLEKQVDHKQRFRGQSDHCALGSVPGRYKKSLSTVERKERVLDTLKASLLEALDIPDMDKDMQSCFLRFGDAMPFDLSWNHLVGTRNPKLITWVLNASINSVVTPDLRKLWGYFDSALCPLCGHQPCSLSHILVGCHVALKQRRYSWRHDSVLATIQEPLRRHIKQHNASPKADVLHPIAFRSASDPLPKHSARKPSTKRLHRPSLLGSGSDWKVQIDFTMAPIPFPLHICVTTRRPDIVIYSDNLKIVILVELTCPAEENITDARQRKEIKYTPLRSQIIDNGWTCHLITIEVGARGFVAASLPYCLRRLGFAKSHIRTLSRKVSLSASRCSFAIYQSHRIRNWSWSSLVKVD